MKIKITQIVQVSKKTGNEYPHMIKNNHKGLIDVSELPKIIKEYNSEMIEGFEAVIRYRQYK